MTVLCGAEFGLLPEGLAQERLRELDAVENRLYHFVTESQLQAAAENRYRGGWPIYSKLGGVIFSHEPNSYLTARQLLLLQETGDRHELPDFVTLTSRANANLMPFLYDSGYTGEPGGTISFWPIQDYASGRRGIRESASMLVPAANVPNDLDTSSLATLWFLGARQQSSFVRAFVRSVGDFRDVDRLEQFPDNLRWKQLNSGAFLSWADFERTASPNSRIPTGINNVDCVVGMNILTALSQYRHFGHFIPTATERGERATCRLVVNAVRSGSVPACSVYYDRASEFWWTFSLALEKGVACLEPALKTARWRLLNRAVEIARAREAASNGTEVAEILASLKRLYPAARRPERIVQIIERLDAILRGMVNDEGRLITEDSISRSRGFGMQLEWYAPAFSSALALDALTLP